MKSGSAKRRLLGVRKRSRRADGAITVANLSGVMRYSAPKIAQTTGKNDKICEPETGFCDE